MQSAAELLDHEYLEARSMLVEIAAALDRIGRAAERDSERLQDHRLNQLYQSLAMLSEPGAENNRSERLLNMFSE